MWVVERGQDQESPRGGGSGSGAAAIDAALDALVAGHAVPRSGGAELPIVNAATSFHALDAQDSTPDPRSGFIERLEATLLSGGQRTAEYRETIARSMTPSRFTPSGRFAQPRPDRSVVAWVSTAAMVVLTLTLVFATFRWSDQRSGPGDRAELAGSGAASATPGPVACDALPSGSVVELVLRVDAIDARSDATVAAVHDVLTRRADLLGIGVCPVLRDGPDTFVVRYAESPELTREAVTLALGSVGLFEIVAAHSTGLQPGSVVQTSLGGPGGPTDVSANPATHETIVSSADVTDAFLTTDAGGQYAVGLTLSDDASQRLCDHTSGNVGRSLGVVLDKIVLYAITTASPICTGQGFVEGLSLDQMQALLVQLQSGPLPAPVEVVQERTPATPAGLPRVTMLTGPEIVDVSECISPVRPPGSVEALAGEEPTRESAFPLRVESTPRAGSKQADNVGAPTTDPLDWLPQADASVVAQVNGTFRQLVACLPQTDLLGGPPKGWDDRTPYDDYNGPFFGNFSDDYFRRELVANVANVDLPVLDAIFILLGPRAPNVSDVRVLPDGRVVVVLPSDFFPSVRQQVVLVREGDRWLIDEVNTVLSEDRDFEAEAAAAPQYLEIALFDDDGTVWGPVDPDQKVVADKDLVVRVANFGTLPQRFEILGLGVSLEVAPGHSVAFVVNAPPGETTIVSSRLDPDGGETQVLDDPLTFRPAETFCRFCG